MSVEQLLHQQAEPFRYTGTYYGDYNDMDSLREIIYGKELSMILVTHNHKPEDADPLNRIYGSAGLTGAVDGIFVLEKHKRTGDRAKLIVTNRDTESYQFEILFNRTNCRWEFVREIRDEEPVGEEKVFALILSLLREADPWKGTATELCEEIKILEPGLLVSPVGVSRMLKSNQDYLRKKYEIASVFSRNKAVFVAVTILRQTSKS